MEITSFKQLDDKLLISLVNSDKLSGKLIKDLHDHNYWYIRLKIAKHKNTPRYILKKLIFDVEMGVAANAYANLQKRL